MIINDKVDKFLAIGLTSVINSFTCRLVYYFHLYTKDATD